MNLHHPLLAEELQNIAALELPWDALAGKTVAVTGATGLVGSYLLRALDAINRAHDLKLHLIALCRRPEAAQERLRGIANLRFHPYDACAALSADFRADFIVHAASNAHPLAFSTDPVGTMQANLLGTMQLLEHVRATGGRLLFLSTGEIYGENPALASFDEHSFGSVDPMRFRACYPESKRAAETLCASYVRQFGADAVVARLCYIYGPTIAPANSRADAQFLRRALAGEDIVMKSAGSQLRSYAYVADAVSALLTVLLRGETGRAYNVANRESTHTIREYAETLARLAGVRVTFELPPEAERQGYSTVTRAVQNPARLEALGWRPFATLEEGLRHTLDVLR